MCVFGQRRLPEEYRDLAGSFPDGFPGEGCIIDPRGEVLAGPAEGETILMADGSTERIYAAKWRCDAAGHYSRPDVFQLRVNRGAHSRVVDMQESEGEAAMSEAAPEDRT